jgi:Mg2+/Co2+ transporter CorC
MIILDTTNGHNAKVIAEFNKVSAKFEDTDLLNIILSNWADDFDIEEITNFLNDRLDENN